MSPEKVHERWFDLININSVNGREIHAARYVDEVLKTFGMTADWSYFPEDTEHQRPSLTATLDSGRPGKTLLLIGHLDTVDVTENWATDPFKATLIDGKVYGRGAMDMKGGLAAILSTLEYFVRALISSWRKTRSPLTTPSWPNAVLTTSPWVSAAATASRSP